LPAKLQRAGRDSHTIRITMPPGIDGRRKQKRLTVKGSKKDALAAVERFKAGLIRGDYVDPGRTIMSTLLDRWLESRGARVERSTYDRYESIVNQDVRPVLGHLRLSHVTPPLVEEAIARWRGAPRRDRKGGQRSERTVHHIYSVLRAVLNSGVRWEMLPRNPCDLLEPLPKGGEKVEGLGATEVPLLLAGLRDTIIYIPALVAAFGGLRRGEVLGLGWTNTDLATGIVSITQALDEGRDKSMRLKVPKTKKSRRTVVLPEFVVAELRRHRSEIVEHFGNDRVPGVVFPNWETGAYWSPDAMSSTFYYLVRTRQLPRVSFHGLRHTYSNIMKAAGVPLLVTSRALGHSDVSTTGNIYTDVTPPDLFDAARRLHMMFGKWANHK
jgi:integrase